MKYLGFKIYTGKHQQLICTTRVPKCLFSNHIWQHDFIDTLIDAKHQNWCLISKVYLLPWLVSWLSFLNYMPLKNGIRSNVESKACHKPQTSDTDMDSFTNQVWADISMDSVLMVCSRLRPSTRSLVKVGGLHYQL